MEAVPNMLEILPNQSPIPGLVYRTPIRSVSGNVTAISVAPSIGIRRTLCLAAYSRARSSATSCSSTIGSSGSRNALAPARAAASTAR
jgi:hypothetical protein